MAKTFRIHKFDPTDHRYKVEVVWSRTGKGRIKTYAYLDKLDLLKFASEVEKAVAKEIRG